MCSAETASDIEFAVNGTLQIAGVSVSTAATNPRVPMTTKRTPRCDIATGTSLAA